jgi:hypothetical protein
MSDVSHYYYIYVWVVVVAFIYPSISYAIEMLSVSILSGATPSNIVYLILQKGRKDKEIPLASNHLSKFPSSI